MCVDRAALRKIDVDLFLGFVSDVWFVAADPVVAKRVIFGLQFLARWQLKEGAIGSAFPIAEKLGEHWLAERGRARLGKSLASEVRGGALRLCTDGGRMRDAP